MTVRDMFAAGAIVCFAGLSAADAIGGDYRLAAVSAMLAIINWLIFF